MVRTNLTVSRRVMSAENAVRAAVAREQRADFGTLVLDGRGIVVSCSDSAMRMFGDDLCDLEGSTIWSLLTSIAPSDTSPSFNARYMGFLSKSPDWHRVQAIDVYDHDFPVEILLAKMTVENDDLFLLIMRHPFE